MVEVLLPSGHNGALGIKRMPAAPCGQFRQNDISQPLELPPQHYLHMPDWLHFPLPQGQMWQGNQVGYPLQDERVAITIADEYTGLRYSPETCVMLGIFLLRGITLSGLFASLLLRCIVHSP